jgi:hypothetical protein
VRAHPARRRVPVIERANGVRRANQPVEERRPDFVGQAWDPAREHVLVAILVKITLELPEPVAVAVLTPECRGPVRRDRDAPHGRLVGARLVALRPFGHSFTEPEADEGLRPHRGERGLGRCVRQNDVHARALAPDDEQAVCQ